MKKFLVRNYDSPNGYCVSTTPTDRKDIFVPWAVTHDCRKVIYAHYGEHRGFNSIVGAQLRPYDTFVSQQRQKLCTSALGMIALSNFFTHAAVKKVSAGVRTFLLHQANDSPKDFKQTVFKNIAHYFYTGGGMGYGRISEIDKKDATVEGAWRGILEALVDGSLEQQLAIHDAVGRKLLSKNDPEKNRYDVWGSQVREEWFDNKDQRGRVESAKSVQPTNIPGIVPTAAGIGLVKQQRNRGVDMFERDTTRLRHPNADIYYDELDINNLAFGAGISGTTGTLLQAALVFGDIDISSNSEELKQYTLAIIGYLIGGGMHSYHEIMAIAKRVGMSYDRPGSFDWLPYSFVHSFDFTTWRDSYYDIAVLGATHWRFNPGVLPSHLNKNLRVHT